MGAQHLPADPDIGIPDLISRLGDDSKRLVTDEVQLARLELREGVERAGRGVVWLASAFGLGVVAMVAATLLLVTLIGRLVAGHMWVGALVTGAAEVLVGAYLVRRGVRAFTAPSYSFEQTRDTLTRR